MVDDIIPSCPHLICSHFLAIFKDMISQDTSQTLVIIVYIIYMTVLAFASPTTSSVAHSTASSYSTLFASSTHASLEVRSLVSSADVSCISSTFYIVARVSTIYVTVVIVIYHYVERIWRILVTPNLLYNIYDHE